MKVRARVGVTYLLLKDVVESTLLPHTSGRDLGRNHGLVCCGDRWDDGGEAGRVVVVVVVVVVVLLLLLPLGTSTSGSHSPQEMLVS